MSNIFHLDVHSSFLCVFLKNAVCTLGNICFKANYVSKVTASVLNEAVVSFSVP